MARRVFRTQASARASNRSWSNTGMSDRFSRRASVALAAFAAFLLASCGSEPVRPGTYTVKRGDTLYAIAFKHRLDYRELARWNRIGRDYTIYPGQVLKLASGVTGSSVSASTTRAPPGTKTPSATQPSPPPPRVMPAWQWPVRGGMPTLTSRPNGGYGLTIGGRLGDEIRSAGDGSVVYTGSGLLGYGQLLIIKHGDSYLSAYGHTQSIQVREGEAVRGGQQVATMGNGPKGEPLLYFEIRVNGAPVNPLPLLPQR
jgi:lipoprotein NlpD